MNLITIIIVLIVIEPDFRIQHLNIVIVLKKAA